MGLNENPNPNTLKISNLDGLKVEMEVVSIEEVHTAAVTKGVVILCAPCSIPAVPSIYGEITKGLCGKCRQDVWVSKSTRETAPLEAFICCIDCIEEELAKLDAENYPQIFPDVQTLFLFERSRSNKKAPGNS